MAQTNEELDRKRTEVGDRISALERSRDEVLAPWRNGGRQPSEVVQQVRAIDVELTAARSRYRDLNRELGRREGFELPEREARR